MALQTKFTITRDLWDEAGVKQSPRIESKTFTPSEVKPSWMDLAAATATTIYLPTDVSEQVGAFDYLWLHNTSPTATIEVELTCKNLDAAENIFVLKLPPGCWLLLSSDDSRYSISAGTDGFSGTVNVINQVRVKADAACKMYMEIGQ